MDKRFSGQLTVAFVCMILGLMLATQFKNVQRVGGNVSMQRTQELTGEVQRLKEENEKMRIQIQEYDQKYGNMKMLQRRRKVKSSYI